MLARARAVDELRHIAGAGCPYTLPIAGRPLIDHALRCLAAAGVTEILVAADSEILEEVSAAASDPGVPVSWFVRSAFDGDQSTLAAAAAELGAGPVLVHSGDALLPDGFGRLELDRDVVYTRANEPVAFALTELAAAADAERVELDGAWKYDATVDGILEGNRLALDAIKRGRIGADLSTTSVQGRVQIHPTAILDGATLRGPVYIGPGAVISETYVGPYTTIAADVRLEGVEIENSIVLPGAAIRFPGRRLEASLVGEGAQIGRDFSLPSALRLRVGRGADIQLS